MFVKGKYLKIWDVLKSVVNKILKQQNVLKMYVFYVENLYCCRRQNEK